MAHSKFRLSPKDIENPIDFITTFLRHPNGDKVSPHDAQTSIINAFTETDQFVDLVVEAGRQLGKSVVLSWLACWYLVRFSNRHVWIVAPSLDQSRIIYDEIVRQFETTALKMLIKRKPIDFPFPHLQLINGSHAHGRGANSPKYLRGKTVHLLIEDEAAYFKEGIHPSVIEPMFTVTSMMEYTGIIRISTPFGEGDFDDGVKAAKANTNGRQKYLHFTSYDNPYANIELLNSIKERYGEDSLLWRTEYLAESVGSELAVFPAADIKWAYENYPYVTDKGGIQYPVPPQANHRYSQGVDLANRRDFFLSTILDSSSERLAIQVNHTRQNQRGYSAYKSTIRQHHHRYNRAPTLVDATSLGEAVVEDLQDIRAEGYRFSGTTAKYELVQGLVRALNEKRVVIPYIPELINELKNFQYEITPGKVVKMEAKKGHDDYVMSLALAVELATRPTYTGFFLGGFGGSREPKIPETGYDPFAELFKEGMR